MPAGRQPPPGRLRQTRAGARSGAGKGSERLWQMNGKAAPSRPDRGCRPGGRRMGRRGHARPRPPPAAPLGRPPLRRARGARPVRQRGSGRARRDGERAGRAGRRAHDRRARRRPGRHVPHAGHPAAHRPHPGGGARPRPGQARAAAPPPRPLGAGSASAPTSSLVTVGYAQQVADRRRCTSWRVMVTTFPGMLLAAAGIGPAGPGRRHVLPLRAPQDALRDLVGRAPLHLPRGGALVRRTSSAPARRSSTTRWPAPGGSPSGR